MNVKEAIEKLKKFPEEAKILALQISLMPDDGTDYSIHADAIPSPKRWDDGIAFDPAGRPRS